MDLVKRGILLITGLLPGIMPVMMYGQAGTKLAEDLSMIMLQSGFKIEIYTDKVPDAWQMAFAGDGTLFVGSMDAGKIYAVRPDRSVYIIDDSLDMPAGLDYFNGDLYVAEVSGIIKYKNVLECLEEEQKPKVVNANFPREGINAWRFIRIGEDSKIYIPMGVTCNDCYPDSTWQARILRMSLDGKELEYFIEGVRNPMGFDWDPATRVFWFIDNSSDDKGDKTWPDEMNRAMTSGVHYGFPYVHGNELDPAYWPLRPKNMSFTTAAWEFPPHVGAQGMCFYTGQMFDKKYRGGIFIAEHGSSYKGKKAGFRISYITVIQGRPLTYEVVASGWLQGDQAWGRPVDVTTGPDGALYVSDEKAGCIYRIYK